MELKLTEDAEACVLFGKEAMLPYFRERKIPWSLEQRAQLYRSLEIYEVWKDGLIGYLAFREAESRFYLADIQISSNQRNKGIGTYLLQRTRETARSRGYEAVYLKVFKSSPAINLYKKFGYNILSEEEHVFLMRLVA